jgi:lysophospholipase L1-like esterase
MNTKCFAARILAAVIFSAAFFSGTVLRAQNPTAGDSAAGAGQGAERGAVGVAAGDASELAETKAQLNAATARLAETSRTLQDWPNLARYREANGNLAAPAPAENRVVFMGDSITDMWAEARFGGFFPGKPYVDRGISGQTTPQMLVRFRPDVLALAPKVVVILAGTNDIAGNTGPMTLEEIAGNLQSMAELANANGIRVILASVMPVSDYGHNAAGAPLNMTGKRPPEKILQLNAWIKKYAEEHHEVYLDYFSAMVDEKGFLKNDLSTDGLHPNAAGYAVMAPLAEASIANALKN